MGRSIVVVHATTHSQAANTAVLAATRVVVDKAAPTVNAVPTAKPTATVPV